MRSAWTAIVAAAIAIGGCQRAGDEAAEAVAEKAIANAGRDASVEIDRARGSIVIDLGAATRPKRWPVDVPFYPHAHRARAGKLEGDRQKLTLRSRDRLAELEKFYRERFSADGWTVESSDGTLRARKAGREIVARFEQRDPVRGVRAVFDIRGTRG